MAPTSGRPRAVEYHPRESSADAALEAVAQAVLGDPRARLLDRSEVPVGGALTAEIGISGGVIRVTGHSLSGRQTRSWR